jgi:hypothetical protein
MENLYLFFSILNADLNFQSNEIRFKNFLNLISVGGGVTYSNLYSTTFN